MPGQAPPRHLTQANTAPRVLLQQPRLLHAAGLVECDEATTVPVDHEAVPGQVKCEDMMNAPVEREAMPQSGSPSDVSFGASANLHLASRCDAGLSCLRFSAGGRFSALRSRASLPAVIGLQWRAAVQPERSPYGAIVAALRENLRGLWKRERKHCGRCDG